MLSIRYGKRQKTMKFQMAGNSFLSCAYALSLWNDDETNNENRKTKILELELIWTLSSTICDEMEEIQTTFRVGTVR